MFLNQLLAALASRHAAGSAAPVRERAPDGAPPPGTAHYGAGLVKEPTVQAVYDAAATEGGDPLAAFLALPTTDQLKLIEAELEKLEDHEKRLVSAVLQRELDRVFIPTPGPQTQALLSQADVLLYGGAAGGGKSFLEIGCAATEHERSLIVRRQSVELDGLIKDSQEMLRGRGSFNGTDKEWTLADGRSLRFGGIKEPDEWRKYAGQARDFMGFDEAAEFLEEQVGSLLGWLRSTKKGQRCRAILASNPPRGAEGRWIIEWFAPWLDTSFPRPAAPGELRWAVYAGGETLWVDDVEFDEDGAAKPVLIDGEEYTPLSRTFIPARLDDNPYLARTNYRAGLQSLPEPLRSQLLKGDFLAGRQDDDWQVIPSEWIAAAQARWTPQPPLGAKMTSIAADLAYGGSDATVLSPRYGSWFAPQKVLKGLDTKDGALVASQIVVVARDGAEIVLDVGGGYASGPLEHFKALEIEVAKFNGAEASAAVSKDGLKFRNRRAELHWKLREALDPNSGAFIALPPDPELAADLATPRWRLTPGGILVESKEDIRKRLGRSPDKGDAVVMANGYGTFKAAQRDGTVRHQPTANLGYAQAKRHTAGSHGGRQTTANTGRGR